ncbi:hypothetical protein [Salipaludibacillus keqinensis]|nr:hypothetical protein [Salipaludibacillus keqinensis]
MKKVFFSLLLVGMLVSPASIGASGEEVYPQCGMAPQFCQIMY